MEAACGFFWSPSFRSRSSSAGLLLNSGPCLRQNQTFICGLRRFHHHRRLSLDSSAGPETIPCEALDLLLAQRR